MYLSVHFSVMAEKQSSEMTDRHVIRAARQADAEALDAISAETGLSEADDLNGFGELLAGSLDGSLEGHVWIALEAPDGAVIGGAYYAPEPFSDRVWNLYFIAVLPAFQGAGLGGLLISHVEATVRELGEQVARILLVETSSLDRFTLTRQFYRNHGYDEEARIREFYGPGDDKVVFWKSLYASSGQNGARVTA